MKINRLLSVCMCVIFALIALTSCGKPTSTKNNKDSIIGKWKSEIGVELDIYENGTYKRNTDYVSAKWMKLQNKNEYEFIDRDGASQSAFFTTSADGDCLEIENWGKFYRIVSEENNKKGFEYSLTRTTLFNDNRTIIEYTDKNGEKYAALIDMQGNILYKEASAHIANYYYEGYSFSGVGVIMSDQKVYTILNKDGKVITTSQNGEFDKVLAYGDGLVLVYKDNSNINGASHCYGILDNNGKWKQPLTQINDLSTFTQFRYAGEGIFQTVSSYYNDTDWAYDSKTGSVVKLGVTVALNFKDGETYYQYGSNIYKVDSKLNTSEVTGFDRIIHGTPVKTVDTNHIQIYNFKTKNTITISKYEANQIEVNYMKFSGGDTFLIINGKDGNKYYTIIDENGNEYYEPKKIEKMSVLEQMCDFNFSESKLSYQTKSDAYTGVNYVTFEDINGNIIAQDVQATDFIDDITFNEDVAVVLTTDNKSLFVNSKGEIILKNLYE